MTMSYRTERFDEMELSDRVGLIGNPVTIGVYAKPTDNDQSERMVVSLTGTVVSIAEDSSEVEVIVEGDRDITWPTERHYALVTWLDETV